MKAIENATFSCHYWILDISVFLLLDYVLYIFFPENIDN